MDDKEKFVKRSWSRCKTCEYLKKRVSKRGRYSFCSFWGLRLKNVKWCNK